MAVFLSALLAARGASSPSSSSSSGGVGKQSKRTFPHSWTRFYLYQYFAGYLPSRDLCRHGIAMIVEIVGPGGNGSDAGGVNSDGDPFNHVLAFSLPDSAVIL